MKIAMTNEQTKAHISAWIDRVAALPERHSVDAWLDHVDSITGEYTPIEGVSIEMRGQFTASGNPELLHIPASLFDIVEIA